MFYRSGRPPVGGEYFSAGYQPRCRCSRFSRVFSARVFYSVGGFLPCGRKQLSVLSQVSRRERCGQLPWLLIIDFSLGNRTFRGNLACRLWNYSHSFHCFFLYDFYFVRRAGLFFQLGIGRGCRFSRYLLPYPLQSQEEHSGNPGK